MKKILLILPYFGKWPVWFDAFLTSVDKNDTIDWLIPTDCLIPESYPANITFLKTTLKEINVLINSTIQCNVTISAKKFCDLKPAFGEIFQEYITSYDFWGITDLDIIYGDIRKFITNELLNKYGRER